MRKQIKLTVEIGDANYVKPGEYFAILAPDGKTIVSLQRREDDLSMRTGFLIKNDSDEPIELEVNLLGMDPAVISQPLFLLDGTQN